MKSLVKSVALGAALICALSTATNAAHSSGKASVLAANAGFYAALNKMFVGDLTPMKSVWSHASDVTYMGPTGNYEHGWATVLKDWEGQAAMKLGGKVEPSDFNVIVGGNIAVVSNYELGENTNADGKVQTVKLRATNIYRLEKGHWRMIGHHTDTLPYLQNK